MVAHRNVGVEKRHGAEETVKQAACGAFIRYFSPASCALFQRYGAVGVGKVYRAYP